jgi:DNA repair protein RadC
LVNKSFTVHDLPAGERPRERLVKFGVESMSLQELLAVVLGRGVQGMSVIDMAQELVGKFETLEKMSDASIAELKDTRGMGVAKATQLKAVFELARRLNEENSGKKSGAVIKSPEDAVRAVGTFLQGKKREHFLVISLDTRNHLIETHVISIGSLDSSIVHPREVFNPVIKDHAAAVILVHNHPSGNPDPSEEDIRLTRQLVESGRMLGIDVLDHIVVCDTAHYSMKDKNII